MLSKTINTNNNPIMENIMRTSRKITTKTETRVTKHTQYEYEYNLTYVAHYKNDILTSISKHEYKFFDVSVQGASELRGGLYMSPINKFSPTFQVVAKLFNTQQA